MADTLDFSRRADLVEEMDRPCSYEDLSLCLRDLALVNWLTGAHRPVMKWLDEVTGTVAARRFTSADADAGRPLKIVDVGSGYGDMLRRIERWARRRGVGVELVGIDVNANSIRAAREATPAGSAIQWVHGDVYSCAEAAQADVFTVSGVAHHLTDEEIVRLLAWMEQKSQVGWFIVDLHRKPVPYRVFGGMMRGPWWHRFIRTDGLRSLRRSFLEQDWARLCAAAGLGAEHVEIREHRPARLFVARMKSA
jgi:SAM-dependent methyltransferase